MESKDRFNRIQETRERSTFAIVEPDLADRHLEGEPDAEFLEQLEAASSYPSLDIDVAVTREEADGILADLRAEFHSNRIDLMLNEMRGDVLRAIIGPFGLGRVLAAYDKTGGNVDTVHNVRNKDPKYNKDPKDKEGKPIYATEEEKKRYEEREQYGKEIKKRARDGDKRYTDFRDERSDQQEENPQGVKDEYTGESMTEGSEMHVDHVVSIEEIHNDPARILADLKTEDLANMPENLVVTDGTINKSKGKKSIEKYLEWLPGEQEKDLRNIKILEEKENRSPKEEEDLEDLKRKVSKRSSIDPDKMRRADAKAREKRDEKINWSYYTSRKFARSTLTAGVNEGAKMGLQQAVGLVIVEFLAASFDETRLAIASVRDGSKVIPAVKSALGRVKDRILEKWQDVLIALGSGSLSGFLSSLLTTLINTIVTTRKRVVRMIREGVFSFLKALKVALFPGEGVSFSESLHAASKLLLSGVIVAGGVALEEVIETAITGLVPGFAFLAVPLTAAIVGGFTALAIAVACYILDRIDLFGAVRLEEDRFVIGRLDENMDGRQKRWDELVEELSDALS